MIFHLLQSLIVAYALAVPATIADPKNPAPPKRPAAVSKSECLASFAAETVLPSLIPKARSGEMVRASTVYAQCEALRTRNGNKCGMLSFVGGNALETCRDKYYSKMILWRDLAMGIPPANFDVQDYRACRNLIQAKSAQDPKVKRFCDQLGAAYVNHTSFCGVVNIYFPEAERAAAGARCEKDMRDFRPMPKPGDSGEFSDATTSIASHLFRQQKPNCAAYPFSGPFASGACMAIFEPKSCDVLLNTIKDSYCSIVSDTPAPSKP